MRGVAAHIPPLPLEQAMAGFRIEELAPGVFARIGSRPLDTNSGIIVGDDGVMVVDSGYSPAAARDLADDIARITAKPVTTLIVSHHHWDHAWGNQVFAGARIIGHVNARTAMETEPESQMAMVRGMAAMAASWYDLTPETFTAQIAELRLTPPGITYSDTLSLWTGGREVRLCYLGPGHTFGDTFVYLPAERVLFAGDMVCNHLIPVVGDGDPFNFGRVLAEVARLDLAAIVPGHGGLAGRKELDEFRACLASLCAEVATARAQGAPDPRAAFACVSLTDFGDWHGRELLPGSVRRIYRALDQGG